MSRPISEELQGALKTIIDAFEQEDQSVRERQIRLWKRLEFMWSGITNVWWSETAHNWKIWDDDSQSNSNMDDQHYDKELNVFRAYLESIIAAMSGTVPTIKCSPDDAENVEDILTAKGADLIAELIATHNDADLKWIKALFIYCTQGMIAGYNYSESDEKYGNVKVAKYEETEEETDVSICPNCMMQMQGPQLDVALGINLDESLEFDPNDGDVAINNLMNMGTVCPNCMLQVDPILGKEKIFVKRLVGETDQPKSRQCLEVLGGLFVKVPNYAKCQKDVPYLAYCYETHYTNVFAKFPDFREMYVDLGIHEISNSANNEYERWGRLSPQYLGDYPTSTPTVRNWWLRPSAFEMVNDEKLRKELKKKFPNGCRCVWVNELFAEACNESLDDHWTLTYNPLSEYIHFDPLGLLLTSVQEITNDLISLTLQTIEHGIPLTFADPKVFDFNAYQNNEATPGAVIPVKSYGGKSISEGFHTLSTTSLSPEVDMLGNRIQEMGQFISGALPSLYGGAQPGSSRTASQYAMSNKQAMQRLQTPWKMINVWWKNCFGKMIPAYIKDMLEDERIVKRKHNSFINSLIKRSELNGTLGNITTSSSDEIPHNWGSIKDTVIQLMETQNPLIMESLMAPNNLQIFADAIGLPRFNIVGEDDRQKQLDEIQLLLQSAPMPGGVDPMGQPTEMPSIFPEFEVDNHKIQAEVCREYLVSESGRQIKVDNEKGYKNILLHLQIHIQMLQQLSAPPATNAPQQQSGQEKLRPVS